MDLAKLFESNSSKAKVFFFVNKKQTRDSNEAITTKKSIKSLVTMGEADTCYLKASELYKTLITTLPISDIDDAWLTFKAHQKEAIEEYGKLTRALIHSTDNKDLKQVMGFVTFIGLLFREHLVDSDIIQNWLENILTHQHRNYFQQTLMHVIKDTVKLSIENGIMDNATGYINKALFDHNFYEEEEQVVTASKEQIKGFQRLNKKWAWKFL